MQHSFTWKREKACNSKVQGGSISAHSFTHIDSILQLLLPALELVLLGKLFFSNQSQDILQGCFGCFVPVLIAGHIFPRHILVPGVAHGEFQAIRGDNLVHVGLLFAPVLLNLPRPVINLRLRRTALLGVDGNLVALAGGLVQGTDNQDAVGVEVNLEPLVHHLRCLLLPHLHELHFGDGTPNQAGEGSASNTSHDELAPYTPLYLQM
mmetsp:Transcript_44441/g.72000  ORF Transcript_44441/g.72000 Transcript_44441/m.72000 type:complete len:208 (-) Transcript_44441:32-655(-)